MGQRFKRVGMAILRQKYLWTILAFVALTGFIDPNSYYHRFKLEQENDELREQIKAYEDRYNADTKSLYELQRSPEAVERVARVNLYMKTADEDVYVVEE